MLASGVRVRLKPEGILDRLGDACLNQLKQNRGKRRMIELLRKSQSEQSKLEANASLNIHYFKSPRRFLSSDNLQLSAVELGTIRPVRSWDTG